VLLYPHVFESLLQKCDQSSWRDVELCHGRFCDQGLIRKCKSAMHKACMHGKVTHAAHKEKQSRVLYQIRTSTDR
jgi:hypothetical protein